VCGRNRWYRWIGADATERGTSGVYQFNVHCMAVQAGLLATVEKEEEPLR